MKIISYNVNGIRAAIDKGFLQWLQASNADVVCLQEVKALEEQVDMQLFADLGYHVSWFAAEKKGYSGVAILSKQKPDRVIKGIEHELFDAEGRAIRADFGDLSIFSVYFPSGTTGDVRQEVKYQFLDHFFTYAKNLEKARPYLVFAGDFNVAHLDMDIHNPDKQQQTSGFLPQERAWVTKLLAHGYTDSFRFFNSEPKQYSWWSYRAGARAKNLGWRIDYIMVTDNLSNALKRSGILPEAKHSDHCPIFTELSM
ncbi:MAG: exodeoxyribonuclease III [Luteibaculaceae bacterium]